MYLYDFTTVDDAITGPVNPHIVVVAHLICVFSHFLQFFVHSLLSKPFSLVCQENDFFRSFLALTIKVQEILTLLKRVGKKAIVG